MSRQQIALALLRWSVGLVVLWQSWHGVVSAAAMRSFYRMGLPHWIRPALGVAEIIAAIVFLVPKWYRTGGYALLMIFLVAAILHILHGEFDIGVLAVYSASVLVCTWTKAPMRARA